jgi:hypothetical protein
MTLSARVIVPPTIPYPRHAVLEGVKACGFRLETDSSPADILITWTPWQGSPREAETRRHRIVMVMENGWWSPLARKAYYQLALNGFNGQGTVHPDYRSGQDGWPTESRSLPWLGAHEKDIVRPVLVWDRGPWLVVGQRGSNSDYRAMPNWWPEKAAARLLATSGHRALIHQKGSGEPAHEILERTRPRAVVTWSSNFASWALWYGVPVFYCGPSLMVQGIARRWHEELPAPEPYEVGSSAVEALFKTLAWAQWNEDELSSGLPFKQLLNMKDNRRSRE